MKNHFWMSLICCLWVGFWILAGVSKAESLGFSLSVRSGGGEGSTVQVQVLDDVSLQPISGAQVSISDGLGAYDSNFSIEAETPADGTVQFGRPSRGPLVVGVFKEGYVAFSLVGVKSDEVTVYLKPLQLPSQYSLVTGNFGGWSPSPSKKHVQAGLVFRSMSAMDLLDFQVHTFFSPLKDTIEVWGKREIPSNVTLPDQEISFFLGTIRLNKPQFRVPLFTERRVRLGALQGVSKVSDVMAALQGGGFSAELLNKLTFSRFGVTEGLTPVPDLRKDLNGDYPLTPALYTVKVSRPPFASDVMVMSGLDMNQDRQSLIPEDIKTAVSLANPGQVRPVKLGGIAQSIPGSEPILLAAAVGKDAKRMSGVLTARPAAESQIGEFLGVAEVPDFQVVPDRIPVQAPAAGVGLVTFCAKALGPRFDGMKDEEGGEPSPAEIQKTAEYHYTTAVVYVLPGASQVQVPTQNLHPIPPITKVAVSQVEFSPAFDERVVDGREVLQKLSRFTNAFAKKAK